MLKDTEDTFGEIFQQAGGTYQPPTLVLFSDATQSACGLGQAAMGPFYCPGDQKVYIDLSFFRDLDQRFGAPGDFAQAYVVAHEVGHHIQTLTGLSEKVNAARQRARRGRSQRSSRSARNSRPTATPACGATTRPRAGCWKPGDVEEGLRAAAAIGDDRLQKQSQGRVVPESFTHGSSEQRVLGCVEGWKAASWTPATRSRRASAPDEPPARTSMDSMPAIPSRQARTRHRAVRRQAWTVGAKMPH